MITNPECVPTAEIDLEFPCGECEIYKGGDDSCEGCPVILRWSILVGDCSPAWYCPACDYLPEIDKFYPMMFCDCGGPLEYVEKAA